MTKSFLLTCILKSRVVFFIEKSKSGAGIFNTLDCPRAERSTSVSFPREVVSLALV
ncbi:MAG: hypothetical protein LBP29_01395 [Treponema sp.]|nr:hypothetical protein [Treponema sp.]